MKKIFVILLLSLIAVVPLLADDFFDDDDEDFYSYSNLTTGYGALIKEGKVLNSVDLGFTFNLAGMDRSRTFGIGLGTRFDVLFGVSNKNVDSYIGLDFIIGPYFHIAMNRIVSFNITVGPFFNYYTIGNRQEDEHFTIGPGVDASITLTPPSFDDISFSIGSLGSANFGLTDEPVSFSIIPYVSFNIHFTNTYYPPYGSLIIY